MSDYAAQMIAALVPLDKQNEALRLIARMRNERIQELEAERDRLLAGIKAFVDREYTEYGSGAATGDEGFEALEALLEPPQEDKQMGERRSVATMTELQKVRLANRRLLKRIVNLKSGLQEIRDNEHILGWKPAANVARNTLDQDENLCES